MSFTNIIIFALHIYHIHNYEKKVNSVDSFFLFFSLNPSYLSQYLRTPTPGISRFGWKKRDLLINLTHYLLLLGKKTGQARIT